MADGASKILGTQKPRRAYIRPHRKIFRQRRRFSCELARAVRNICNREVCCTTALTALLTEHFCSALSPCLEHADATRAPQGSRTHHLIGNRLCKRGKQTGRIQAYRGGSYLLSILSVTNHGIWGTTTGQRHDHRRLNISCLPRTAARRRRH